MWLSAVLPASLLLAQAGATPTPTPTPTATPAPTQGRLGELKAEVAALRERLAELEGERAEHLAENAQLRSEVERLCRLPPPG